MFIRSHRSVTLIRLHCHIWNILRTIASHYHELKFQFGYAKHRSELLWWVEKLEKLFRLQRRLTDDIWNCCLWLRLQKICRVMASPVSLQTFVVQFNIRIIDLLNMPKYLSFGMDHRVISLGKLVCFRTYALKSRRPVLKQTDRRHAWLKCACIVRLVHVPELIYNLYTEIIVQIKRFQLYMYINSSFESVRICYYSRECV